MLSFVYCVGRLAEARGQNDLVQKADASLARFRLPLGDKWNEVEDAYMREISRIEDEIGAPGLAQLLTGGAVFLLAKLLRGTGTDDGEQ